MLALIVFLVVFGGCTLSRLCHQSDTGALMQIMMDCEEGRLYISKVASVLLCITADASVGFGMLRQKAATLIAHLEGPLSTVDMH
jgi:predicted regulator of Ras-like GTPase activity (Roadblock/LC7/MglB family)